MVDSEDCKSWVVLISSQFYTLWLKILPPMCVCVWKRKIRNYSRFYAKTLFLCLISLIYLVWFNTTIVPNYKLSHFTSTSIRRLLFGANKIIFAPNFLNNTLSRGGASMSVANGLRTKRNLKNTLFSILMQLSLEKNFPRSPGFFLTQFCKLQMEQKVNKVWFWSYTKFSWV